MIMLRDNMIQSLFGLKKIKLCKNKSKLWEIIFYSSTRFSGVEPPLPILVASLALARAISSPLPPSLLLASLHMRQQFQSFNPPLMTHPHAPP